MTWCNISYVMWRDVYDKMWGNTKKMPVSETDLSSRLFPCLKHGVFQLLIGCTWTTLNKCWFLSLFSCCSRWLTLLPFSSTFILICSFFWADEWLYWVIFWGGYTVRCLTQASQGIHCVPADFFCVVRIFKTLCRPPHLRHLSAKWWSPWGWGFYPWHRYSFCAQGTDWHPVIT